jgi:deoxyribodipyrimidine photolyase
MSEIWQNLAQNNIPFLTVHDEIIARQTDTETVKTTIKSVLNKHFKSYKLNIDKLENKQVKEPSEPINKKSFFDIGFDILGEQNNMTKNRLLAEMMQKYNITDTRAGKGFDLLLNNGIIKATNVGTYFMTHSTPY